MQLSSRTARRALVVLVAGIASLASASSAQADHYEFECGEGLNNPQCNLRWIADHYVTPIGQELDEVRTEVREVEAAVIDVVDDHVDPNMHEEILADATGNGECEEDLGCVLTAVVRYIRNLP